MNFFNILGTTLFFLLNVYCYFSLTRNSLFRRFEVFILFVLTLLFSFELAFFFHWSSASEIVYKISIYSIGFTFMAFCVLLPSDILKAIFASKRKKERDIIRIFYDIAVILGLICYICFGIINAVVSTQVVNRQIEIPNLKRPFKAVMVSDLHLGAFLKKNFSKRIVNIINKQNADAVFIVGDFIDVKASKLDDTLEPFENIKSKYGVFFVSGNHEYYNGSQEIFKKIAEANINVLQNQHIELDELNIIGVKDISSVHYGEGADLREAMEDIDMSKPNILLTHQPNFVLSLNKEDLDNIDLILSGHTHAGQIFPFSLLVWIAQKYIYGEYNLNENTKLVVSSGAGFWGPPMRILSNSEVVVLDLKPKK